jgi:hypothetical protein
MDVKIGYTDWPIYVFDQSDLVQEIEPIAETSRLKCRFFRGRENLLRKMWKSESGFKEQDRENIRKEIMAICSNWLKMQNVCALLGAGASKCILGFVGKDMYKRIKNILSKRKSTNLLEELEKMSSEPSKIDAQFEEYLSQLTLFKKLMSETTNPLDKAKISLLNEGKAANIRLESLNDLLLDIERAIITIFNKQLPESSLTLGESEGMAVLPQEAFLAKLVARDPQQGRARIFTTNYDTLIEQAMDRLGIIYSDGFSGIVHRRFNPTAYDLDFYYPGEVSEGRVRRYDKVIQLYKLHGSINWRSSTLQAGDPFGIHFDSRPLPNEEKVLKEPNLLDSALGETEASLGILPISTKYGETLTMPYAHLFRLMFASFKEPQTVCFIIGYKGWDKHINRIVEDSLTNPSFNCVFVDPSLSEWAKALLNADYCGRVYAFEGEWGKFENFAINVFPDVEMLKTDLMIAKTMRDLEKIRQAESD